MFTQRLGDLRDGGDEHQVEEQLEPRHAAIGPRIDGRLQAESGECQRHTGFDAGAKSRFQSDADVRRLYLGEGFTL